MQDNISKSSLSISLPEPVGGVAPDWVQIFPAGETVGRDGRGPWFCDPPAVVARTKDYAGPVDIPIDYDHQLERSARNGQPAPAAGWIKRLEARSDGVWGEVEWTSRGRAYVEAREYRYVSPTFYLDSSGQVLAIESVALTNVPCIAALKALAANGPPDHQPYVEGVSMSFLKIMAAVLGVAGEAPTEAAVEAAARKLVQEAQTMRAGMSTLAATVQSPDANPDNLIKAAASLAARAEEPDPAKYVPVGVFETVNGELAKMKESAALALVEQAKAEGKVTPGQEAWAKEYAASNPEGFKAYLAAAPDQRPGSGAGKQEAKATPPGQDKAGALTDQEKKVCAAAGISEEDYLKSRAALAKEDA